MVRVKEMVLAILPLQQMATLVSLADLATPTIAPTLARRRPERRM
jgi:hypothetical protein